MGVKNTFLDFIICTEFWFFLVDKVKTEYLFLQLPVGSKEFHCFLLIKWISVIALWSKTEL